MKASLRHLGHLLSYSFWPLPTALCFGAIVLALSLLYIDREFGEVLAEPTKTSPEGVRTILSTSATSILTLAGLVFSSTLVALSLASSQYGPRILHNFIRSRANQITLGLLSGNFLVCIMVLRESREGFIPQISVAGAFLLTIASLVAFLFFVHHLVHSLRAENVIASVAKDLDRSLERFFPNEVGTEDTESEAEMEREEWEELDGEKAVPSRQSGYLLRCEIEDLVATASHADLRARVLFRPGQLVFSGDPLLAVEAGVEIEEEIEEKFAACFVLGDQRSQEQDYEFAMRQLVEIAIRALSPGINDPFTALNCVDALSLSLANVAHRRLPRRDFHDSDGNVRIHTRPASFRSLLECAFHQLRQDGGPRPDISIRILEGLRSIAERARSEDRKNEVEEIADLVVESSRLHDQTEFDAEKIRSAAEAVKQAKSL